MDTLHWTSDLLQELNGSLPNRVHSHPGLCETLPQLLPLKTKSKVKAHLIKPELFSLGEGITSCAMMWVPNGNGFVESKCPWDYRRTKLWVAASDVCRSQREFQKLNNLTHILECRGMSQTFTMQVHEARTFSERDAEHSRDKLSSLGTLKPATWTLSGSEDIKDHSASSRAWPETVHENTE